MYTNRGGNLSFLHVKFPHCSTSALLTNTQTDYTLRLDFGKWIQTTFVMGRYKQWNGLLEWNTGLDYWTELFFFVGQVSVFILEVA